MMVINNYLSTGMILADRAWQKFLPNVALKKPVSGWLIQNAVKLDPQNSQALHRFGRLAAANRDEQKAVEAYQTAMQLGYQDQQIYHHLGLALVELQRFDEAAEMFEHAVSITPHASWSYLEWGNVLIHLKRYDSAQNVLKLGLEQEPSNVWLKLKLYQAQAIENQVQKAIDLVGDCLKNLDDEELFHQVSTPDWLKYTATLETVASFEKLIKQRPKPIHIHRALGRMFHALDNVEQSQHHISTAAQMMAHQLVQDGTLNPDHLDLGKGEAIKPSFLILGPHKSGTTSLYDWICRHPKALGAVVKEIRYWSQNPRLGLDWYTAFFLPVQGTFFTGEASPESIYTPHLIAPSLLAAYPDMKLIILVRDSIERAYSHYQMMIRLQEENRSWGQAVNIELELFPKAPLKIEEVPSSRFNYLMSSCLLPFVREWVKLVPAEQLLIVESKRLFSQPEETVSEIFDFIGFPTEAHFEYPHKNKGDYKIEIAADTLARLKEWFAPHDKALKEFLIANAPNLIGDF